MKSAPNNNIVFRDIDRSAALATTVSKKLHKLERYCGDIIRSRVVLEAPHQHKSKGKQFKASVELAVSGNPVTITSENESIHRAVSDAFASAERCLKKRTERRKAQRHQALSSTE
ncbi:ribosome hibernation-promoting factor, HPF/YfiA family [Microbulbifer thermotolerans]|uniref:30S ribosomal protein S30 n=1 Tax=Microbulbifer thermotolerans TaxID=252514 RepID=A0A143HMN3_MICTH|nr:ribosome-associated translation inhibitor RaiA [Microbulbifer thermotolerans]AMX02746.1 30S ribosomal protein S30 [Microbulbifer thermotolerans]MCX2779601.1 ribosome-associated translation inhibitor RaiA [Microbulbifer thermotolerans]MCX2782567.1 ribosome-associated translation inhibitor RaiA [Microbulbifer thermotolerans]MCX2794579.1 ribosome-associated translation inhibitor RaiA [Microbulbifer thermotolerans]MCX2801407.1 ribosome-associated translation inhibitor RaiA [Microbulbifer thermo